MLNDFFRFSVFFILEFGSIGEDGNDRVLFFFEYSFSEIEFFVINFGFYDNDVIE